MTAAEGNHKKDLTTKTCQHHGEYKLTEYEVNKGYQCPKCHQEKMERPFSPPLSINALGSKNKYVIINKGAVYNGMQASPIRHTPIRNLTQWSAVDWIPDASEHKSKIYVIRVFTKGDTIRIKHNGMRRALKIVTSGKITDDMMVQRLNKSALYMTISKAFDCCMPSLLNNWERADHLRFPADSMVADYIRKKGYIFCK